MYKEYPVSVYCPLRKKEETVFVRALESPVCDLSPTFNGCESDFHDCQECETCKTKALKLFTRQSD